MRVRGSLFRLAESESLGTRSWNPPFIKFSRCFYVHKGLETLEAGPSYTVAKGAGLIHLEAI